MVSSVEYYMRTLRFLCSGI